MLENDKNEYLKELVIERLKVLPPDCKISIGSEGNFSKTELIKRIETGDSLGEKIMQIQLKYMQSMKTGVLLDE